MKVSNLEAILNQLRGVEAALDITLDSEAAEIEALKEACRVYTNCVPFECLEKHHAALRMITRTLRTELNEFCAEIGAEE